jgi:hypothetical protein
VIKRTPRADGEHGAAVVEFALVVPVLLLLVFGIIDYGIFFADSLAARSGVREAARQGVVLQCTDTTPFATCLQQLTKERIDPIAGGDEYVKVIAPPPGSGDDDWKRGKELTVCAVVVVNGVTNWTPMPAGGATKAKITMQIEQDTPQPAGPTSAADALPSKYGQWDDFCS